VSQLLYSVIYRASQVERSLKEHDVDYAYSTLGELLASVESNTELSAYASSSGLFSDLYYLAGSTFKYGYPKHAVTLCKALSASGAAGQFRGLSTQQLKKPFAEPLLSITR
jgi:hypothetical protein